MDEYTESDHFALQDTEPAIYMYMSVAYPKFHGENFHKWLSSHEIHDSLLLKEFPAIQYVVC